MDYNEDENTFRMRRRRSRLLFDDQPYVGRRGALTPGANQSVGSIVPAGLVFPNDYDQWDFNSTTDLSGVPDVTAAVQAAINQIQASGQGGIVQLPPGVLRINGVTISGGGVTLRGAGYEEYNGAFGAFSPAQRGRRGTYILTDSVSVSTITVANSANNVKIEDMAFIQPQLPDGGFVSPRVFQPCIAINGPNSGALICQRLLFWGCYTGISLGQNTQTVARVTLRDIIAACFSQGIAATLTNNMLTVDNFGFHPEILQGSPNWQSYIQSAGNGINFVGARSSVVTNFYAQQCLRGILVQNSGGTGSVLSLSDLTMFDVQYGLYCNTTGANIQINGYRYDGNNGNPRIAISTGASDSIRCSNFDFENSGAEFIDTFSASFVFLTMPGTINNFVGANPFVIGATSGVIYHSEIAFSPTTPTNGNPFGGDINSWTAYTPTLSADAGTFTTTTKVGKYHINGSSIEFEASITLTNIGTATGAAHIGMPSNSRQSLAFAGVEETSNKALSVKSEGSALSTAKVTFYDGTSAIANGNVLTISGVFNFI